MIVYMILSYWAAGRTIFRNVGMYGTLQGIFLQKLVIGSLLGIILIPWAIIQVIVGIFR